MAMSFAPSPMASVTAEGAWRRMHLTRLAFWEGDARQQMTESTLATRSKNSTRSASSSSTTERVWPSMTATECGTMPRQTSVRVRASRSCRSPCVTSRM